MKQTTRLIALLCCLALILGMIPAAYASDFTGMHSWAKEDVEAMDQLGLVPQALNHTDLRLNITRQVMCQLAVLSYEKYTGTFLEEPDTSPFTDTSDPDVMRAAEIGLVGGDGNGLFRPNDNLTRQEFFCFVSKFLKAIGYPVSRELYGRIEDFSDYTAVSSWANNAARLCVGIGVVRGNGSGLAPWGVTTAEEAIVMFSRAYTLAVNAYGSPFVPDNSISNSNGAPNHSLTVPKEPTFAELFPGLSKWAVPEVTEMYELALVHPNVQGTPMKGGITRGNMCKIAVLTYKKAMDLPNLQPTKESPFSDTRDADIVLAAELGIVGGLPDGTFCPGKPMTREEFFQISVNLLNALGYPDQDAPSETLSQFSDAGSLGWAKPAARLLVSLGLVNGSYGELTPKASIVCQEAIALFYRCYQFMDTWEPVVEEPEPPAPPEPPEPPEPVRDIAAELVAFACRYEGYPYVYGGQSPSTGFDCSGLVYYVFRNFGYTLNRTADQQYYNGTRVKWGEWKPGDLLFFSTDGSGYISHVGIYVGDNQIIHAANSRTGVIYSNVMSSYYMQHYYSACRIIEQ